MMSRIVSAACAMTLIAGAALSQGTGSEGYFQVYNDTEGHIVVGFYTNDGSDWSSNWLDGVEIHPGENATAEFSGDSGPCEQVLQVGWLGDDDSEVLDDPISIDICDASDVYLGDNEITYD